MFAIHRMNGTAEYWTRMRDWSMEHGLRESSAWPTCIHWLQKRSRGGPPCAQPQCKKSGGFRDHGSGWLREGRPQALVFEPYGTEESWGAEIAALRAISGFRVEVMPGWWHEATIRVVVWNG